MELSLAEYTSPRVWRMRTRGRTRCYAAGNEADRVGGMESRPRVLVVGAGFGGLQVARKLHKKPVDVLLIDRDNYHLFTPLLYQVASSLLNASDIAEPVRSVFRRGSNVSVRQAEVTGIDFEHRIVATRDGTELPYDYLVLAPGSTTNYFGIESAEQRAHGLKDLPEALSLRNHILLCLEAASRASAEDGTAWLTFVVAGGGPTGVEYAGALAELLRLVVPGEYPELGSREWKIVLVEGLPELLPPFAPSLRAAARRDLTANGVEVRTGIRLTDFDGERVTLSDGSAIATRTLVWAAGVRPANLVGAIDAARSRSGRIEVEADMRVKGHANVFAIGDAASFEQGGKEVPMLSAPAMQEGRLVARNILHAIRGEPLQPFRYRNRGSMATIGKNAAVAEVWKLRLTGRIGWMAWLAVHLYYLIGFRNRLVVLAGWTWNYVRSDRPVRIITRANE